MNTIIKAIIVQFERYGDSLIIGQGGELFQNTNNLCEEALDIFYRFWK